MTSVMERKAFFILGFIMFFTMTGYGIVLPTLPFLADSIGLTSFQMGTLITGWAVAQLATAPLWGKLADSWGRKPVLIIGLAGFGVAFLLLMFAQSYWQLLFARMIGAALSSGTQPASFAMISDQTDQKHRNIAVAKMGALNGLGFLCGPAIGGLFTPLGLEAPFIVAGGLAFITLPFAITFLSEPSERASLAKDRVPFFRSFSMLIQPGYWQLFMITFGAAMAASSFFGLLGYFMIDRFQASSIFVSAAFSAQAGISVIVQFFLLEKMYRYFSEEYIAKLGLMAIAIGYGFIAFSPSIWVTIIGCLFTGFGQAGVNPTVISLLSKFNRYGQGMTIGIQQSMNSLGRVIGPLWGGLIYSVHIAGPFLVSAFIAVALIAMLVFSGRESLYVPIVKERSHKLKKENA